MRVLILNGPNLNLLGTHSANLTGKETLAEIQGMVRKKAFQMGIEFDFRQSNIEGELVTWVQEARGRYDVIIINPAAYANTSIAIRDAIVACEVAAIEIHIPNIHTEEEFRKHSLIAPVCIGQIIGFGAFTYLLAMDAAVNVKGKSF